jgi:multimeric flavodoxin WrbA
MRVLGLGAGNPGGSAEILLKCALRAAVGEGASVALVALDSLALPLRPVAPGAGGAAGAGGDDDGPWLWDQLMDADGVIISTPIYSRTITGKLKLVADRLSGPAADVAFAENYRRLLEAGESPPVAFPYDERVFRPRVAGLIAVGGALTTQWRTLALPLLHQMTFSAHIAVADQLLVGGAGMPRAVVLDAAALAGAARVGRSVGAQLGVPFDSVEYRGEAGLCPLCHLSVIEVRAGGVVECATCGAGGRLVASGADGDGGRGEVSVVFDDPAALARSVVTMDEKRAHFAEVMETGAAQGALAAEIERRAATFAEFDPRIAPER